MTNIPKLMLEGQGKEITLVYTSIQTFEIMFKGLIQNCCTIFSQVSNIFRNPSIGTAINIVLVRVMILKENPVRIRQSLVKNTTSFRW